mmetsp:Transcript_64838/g.104764  ORF Transcript_64838/g.104764 Transcript_64838/m.104764 type:complete len:103 (-) Transcript_64838:67-375(-)
MAGRTNRAASCSRSWLVVGCLLAVSVLGTSAKEASADQMATFQKDFIQFDLNKDQQVDAQELRIAVGSDLDQSGLRRLFIDMDRDQSGTVTLEEYTDYAVTL